jgi:nicotinamidase-related amidase
MFARDAVLLSLDLQQWLDHPGRGGRNNPAAERNVARLFAAWRACGLPLVHVRHDGLAASALCRAGQPGHDFKAEAKPVENELVIGKQAHSAFIATELEQVLRGHGCRTLLIVGAGDSLESTVRVSGDLGFRTYLPADATFTFDKLDWSGRMRSAAEVHDMSLANLSDEYCTIVTSTWVLQQLTELQRTQQQHAAA